MCFVELAVLVGGIVMVSKGKIEWSRREVSEGLAVRFAGLVLILALVIALGIAFLLGLQHGLAGKAPNDSSLQVTVVLTELGVYAVAGVIALVLVLSVKKPVEPRSRRRRRDYDYDDYDRYDAYSDRRDYDRDYRDDYDRRDPYDDDYRRRSDPYDREDDYSDRREDREYGRSSSGSGAAAVPARGGYGSTDDDVVDAEILDPHGFREQPGYGGSTPTRYDAPEPAYGERRDHDSGWGDEDDEPKTRRQRRREARGRKKGGSMAGVWIALSIIAAVLLVVAGIVLMVYFSQSDNRKKQSAKTRARIAAADPKAGIRPEFETPRAPGFVPPPDPILKKAKEKAIYLSDLQEFAYIPGPVGWTFGKNGNLGAFGRKILIDGKVPPKGLSTHPPDTKFTRVCYSLGKLATTFEGTVAFSKDEPESPPNPTRFVILADNKFHWRSKSMRTFQDRDKFTVDVTGVEVLELRVYVENRNNFGSHAVWVDPYVKVP